MQFKNEEGIGFGVFKEFLIELSKIAFSVDYGLFSYSKSSQTIYPNPISKELFSDFKEKFEFLGIYIYSKKIFKKKRYFTIKYIYN
jgi:hypothetical protein